MTEPSEWALREAQDVGADIGLPIGWSITPLALALDAARRKEREEIISILRKVAENNFITAGEAVYEIPGPCVSYLADLIADKEP